MKLFRIWNSQLHKFVDSSEWFISPNGAVFYWDLERGITFAPDCVVQLVTNRRDKHDEIIYFGDKLRCITHMSGQTYTEIREVNDEFMSSGYFGWYRNDEMEIIGHINE